MTQLKIPVVNQEMANQILVGLCQIAKDQLLNNKVNYFIPTLLIYHLADNDKVEFFSRKLPIETGEELLPLAKTHLRKLIVDEELKILLFAIMVISDIEITLENKNDYQSATVLLVRGVTTDARKHAAMFHVCRNEDEEWKPCPPYEIILSTPNYEDDLIVPLIKYVEDSYLEVMRNTYDSKKQENL